MRPTLTALTLVAAATTACGGGESFRPRRITAVSSNTKVEENLTVARQAVLDGDLDAAEAALRRVLTRHAVDPLAPTAQLLLARVMLARGEPAQARRLAESTRAGDDTALTLSRTLVLGVVAVREAHMHDGLALLRPLEGRLPDHGETAQLSCALAEAEASAGDVARAFRAVGLLEAVSAEGSPWPNTGLSCEQPDTRGALLERLLSRAEDPHVLADALDALPAGSTLRRPVAVRLRDLAEAMHETPRWLRWLVDLPEETAAQGPIVAASGPAELVVGVLAPLAGPSAAAGVALVRGVQYAVEGVPSARVVATDEGDSPAAAVAALDRLAAQGARAVIGASREDFAAGVAIRAQALGVDVWLLAPALGVEATGARVHLAGPSLEARLATLATAARGRAPRVALVVPAGAPGELAVRLVAALGDAGVTATRVPIDEATARGARRDGVQLVVGPFGREVRATLAHAAERAPERWLFDARSALPGASGTWIGIRPGPELARWLPQYCARVGEPPSELSLLGYDAARAAVARARALDAPPTVLAAGWATAVATVASAPPPESTDVPAAAWRCPAEPSADPRE